MIISNIPYSHLQENYTSDHHLFTNLLPKSSGLKKTTFMENIKHRHMYKMYFMNK
jgi:hypothetical protein